MGVNNPPIDYASIPRGVIAMTADTDYDQFRGYCVDTEGDYTITFVDGTSATLFRLAGVDYGGQITRVSSPAGVMFGLK